MTINPSFIENAREMEVPLYVPAGSNDPNRLFIYTGIAVLSFKGTGGNWLRDMIQFEIGRVFSPGQVRDVIATASLNSISNTDTAVNAGWAVDSVKPYYDKNHARIIMQAALAVRDSDGYLLRIGYQVTVLARV